MISTIRADKLLSSRGLTSRRNVDKFLKENKVFADNLLLKNPGDRVSEHATITVNGKKLLKPKFLYFKINKPKGYISTLNDEYGRKNVINLIKTNERVFPIGRLDKNTHGLILLTNDGELTNLLIHPKKHIPKVYELTLLGNIETAILTKLKNGVKLDDGITQKAYAQILFKSDKKTVLKLTIFEGRKRQIRRMCEALNLNLLDLKRVEFGPIQLGSLKTGESEMLTNKEIQTLKKATGQISQV